MNFLLHLRGGTKLFCLYSRSALRRRRVQEGLYSPHCSELALACAQAGYYCSVCDCILRDSASYLDHINGKYHNRALGMSMRVERSTADDVRWPCLPGRCWLP